MKCSGLRAFMLAVAALTVSGTPAGAQSGVREVSATERGVIPLQTRLRYTTMVVLPDGEEILDVLCGDDLVGTGAVIDDHRLSPLAGELLGEGTREDVGGAARRVGNHDAGRLVCRALRLRRPGQREKRDPCGHGNQAGQ